MLKEEYKNLFAMIARNGQICGENAIEVFSSEKGDNLSEEDRESLKNTEKTIEAYRELEDKILNNKPLDTTDYNYLYIAAKIARPALERNVIRWTAVLNEYDNNLIPNLEKVLLSKDEDKSAKIMELFEATHQEEYMN